MQAKKFVESYFDAWNRHDPAGVAEHLSADGIYVNMLEDYQQSVDELVTTLAEYFEQFPHHYELAGDVLRDGNKLAFQYRMIPTGEISRNQSRAHYIGAEFMTMDDDQSANLIKDYCDIPISSYFPKYAKSGLNKEQLEAYKLDLEQLMTDQQAYLSPDLTLPQLADNVGCTVNHLSQVINDGFGMSFFDYLNSYRVNHARTLLSPPNETNLAILNIALAVGFNSNSAFYTAFKKFVGQTPAQFRRDSLVSNS